MIKSSKRRIAELARDQRGQVLPVMALMLVALLAMTAVVVDLGHALFAYRELQAACDGLEEQDLDRLV